MSSPNNNKIQYCASAAVFETKSETIKLNHVRIRACLVQQPNTKNSSIPNNSLLARNLENSKHQQDEQPTIKHGHREQFKMS